jgi:hypothetical protein
MGTLHEDLGKFMTASRWILLRMRNISDKICSENQNTHFMLNIIPPPLRKWCPLWDNAEKYGTAIQVTEDNMIRRMRFACWITKATDTHSEYVIFIAFPRQQWLHERVPVLRLYVLCHSCYFISKAVHLYTSSQCVFKLFMWCLSKTVISL